MNFLDIIMELFPSKKEKLQYDIAFTILAVVFVLGILAGLLNLSLVIK